MIPALSRNIKGQGQAHRKCEKHIIVDNSGTTLRRNVKLMSTYYPKTEANKQDDVVFDISYIIGLKMFNAMRQCLRHSIPFMSQHKSLTSRRCFQRHDVPFTYCGRHNELFEVMTYF